MCLRTVSWCCHCGLQQAIAWKYCRFLQYLLWSRQNCQYGAVPIPPLNQCIYFSTVDVPVFYGCENNDLCVSWLTTVLADFGDQEDDNVRQSRQRTAEEQFEQYKDNFAKKYCSRVKYVPRNKAPMPFLLAAKKSFRFMSEDEIHRMSHLKYVLSQNHGSRMQSTRLPPGYPPCETSSNNQYKGRIWGPRLSGDNAPPRGRVTNNDSCAVEHIEGVPVVDELVQQNTNSPRLMRAFRPVIATTPMLTKGNPLVTLYGIISPHNREWVTRTEICSNTKDTAAEYLMGLTKLAKYQSKGFRSLRAISIVQSKIATIFK
ncbi:hypothetical protein BGZ63DRAFT_403396 [Mariannaea sp. PMI_226]|nr:hypothetical protein BGZ63DRAFT_403396 [Mariannaea sp. PMI_226]